MIFKTAPTQITNQIKAEICFLYSGGKVKIENIKFTGNQGQPIFVNEDHPEISEAILKAAKDHALANLITNTKLSELPTLEVDFSRVSAIRIKAPHMTVRLRSIAVKVNNYELLIETFDGTCNASKVTAIYLKETVGTFNLRNGGQSLEIDMNC